MLLPILIATAALLTPGSEPEVTATEAALARANTTIDTIVAVPANERTFANTAGVVDEAMAQLMMDARFIGFMSNVHPDLAVREEGEASRIAISNWFTDLFLREDLYLALDAFATSLEFTPYATDVPEWTLEEERLLSELLRDFRRSGMSLSAEQRQELKAIENQLTEVGQEFSKNIRDDETTLALTEDELAGCPDDWREELERSDDLYLLPVKPSIMRPIFRNCTVPETRHKVSLAYARRAGTKNIAVLEKLIKLRAEKAALLGYPSTAHYETEVRMVGTPERALAFYAEIVPKLKAKAEKDFAEYTQAKREHLGDPTAELDPWDMGFYGNWLRKNNYGLDPELVQQYFPMETVVEGLFGVTQELFGIEFREVASREARDGREFWHEDVKLYEVWDNASGVMLGEFYTDLHPRPNKYGHAAQFPLVLRKRWPDGSLSTPVVALVCNFTKPTADKPALLTHGEVETFFHEFGHCLHSILTEAEYANFSGTNVTRDFVEAPSQMLENWIWDRDVLARFARHYETGEPLPDELLDAMLGAKNLGSGLNAEYQVFLGLMDMRFHSDPTGDVDTQAIMEATHAEAQTARFMEGSRMQAGFGHLQGYQAGYYGYLWSLVYAQDMFGRFEELGILDPAAGAYYRAKILARGGGMDPYEMVVDYLEREPSSDAFLEHLGLTVE